MSAPQLYSSVYVSVDSLLLAEESSVTVDRKTGSQPVSTVVKDYAGESPGAKTMNISVETGVPSADFELNPGKYMTILKDCEITLFCAGRTLRTRGFIVEDSL